MNDFNILSILYLSFRLAPVILVSYFALSSLFNQDLKGLIYLAGLILACVITITMGNVIPDKWLLGKPSTQDTMIQNINRVCSVMTLSKAGPISKLPLSQTVFTFTFGYLLFVIVKYKLEDQNIPTLVIFPLLIVSDWIWNTVNSCSKPLALVAATVIGGLIGVAWGAIIDSSKMTKLQYFNGVSSNETCSVPSKQTFKCVIKGATNKNKKNNKNTKENFAPMIYRSGLIPFPITKMQDELMILIGNVSSQIETSEKIISEAEAKQKGN